MGICRRQGIKMVSHGTIYQYIWWDKAHGGELYKHLRHRDRRHKKRGAMRKKRGTIPNRIDISERPKIVDRKKRIGDYEVDTIVGAARSQHILTLNDRKTGKVWLRKLQNPTAAEVGTAGDEITQEFLEEVERKLNERPRKRHGFLSPNQVFSKSTGLDAGAFA